jgi:hypothetical protein
MSNREMRKVYLALAGFRQPGGQRVDVLYDEGTTLERRAGLQLRREPGSAYLHSPSGHSWGYHGSGPAQLALDLLWDVYDAPPAPPLYQAFKAAVIANFDQEQGWRLSEAEIRAWVEAHGGWRSSQREWPE